MSAPSTQSEDLRNDVQFLANTRMGQSVLVWGELSNRLLGCADHIDALEAEIERLRAREAKLVEALGGIEELCNDEIKKRFSSSYTSEADMAKGSRIYPLLSLPRNLARAALADQTGGEG